MVLGGSDPYLTSGSGTTSGTSFSDDEDDDTFSTTSTEDEIEDQFTASGDNIIDATVDYVSDQQGETIDNTIADTDDDVSGGRSEIGVDSGLYGGGASDSVTEVEIETNDDNQITDVETSNDVPTITDTVDNTDQNTSGGDPPVDLENLPIGFGGLGDLDLPSLPSVGEIGGRGVALALTGLGAAAVVFGGE